MPDVKKKWLWVDVETTGLGYELGDPAVVRDDVILEVAAVITDSDLTEVSSFGPFAIRTKPADLELMSGFVRDMHTKTGLLERVGSSAACSIGMVDDGMSGWMLQNGLDGRTLLAGSSVKLDFDFLRRHMPHVFSMLHYRVIDVSSFKEALRSWLPATVVELEQGFVSSHQAMADIRASVNELRHYRAALGMASSVGEAGA